MHFFFTNLQNKAIILKHIPENIKLCLRMQTMEQAPWFAASVFELVGTFGDTNVRDAPLDFKVGSRKFGSGQGFFSSSLARKVFFIFST